MCQTPAHYFFQGLPIIVAQIVAEKPPTLPILRTPKFLDTYN